MNMQIVMWVVIAAAVTAVIAFNAWAAAKRREALAALAARLGLTFWPDRNRDLPARFAFLDRLAKGSNRYAQNVLHGTFREHEVWAFDYHYETHSTDSKGRRQTHHHWFSFFILILPRAFPELLIAPEGILSKIAQSFGYDDIDFESHEFSRTFCVRSRDKKFAYDVCHTRMIEYLLAHRGLTLEIEDRALATGATGRLDASRIEAGLNQLIDIRALMPNYLMEAP